ncbi:DUF6376 family protein [Paenibacillus sp. TRM 82003]|nr:DUF6376 family protein [Paenibacillus sp. TRM 82003]
MKGRGKLVIALALALTLTGCSLLEQVNSSLNYATEATQFVNDANRFAEQVPALAEQALTDPQTIENLKGELERMRDEIVAFNALEAPQIAEDVHQRIVAYNEAAMKEIDVYLQQINENVINLEELANAPMLETLRSLTGLLNEIQQLGQ